MDINSIVPSAVTYNNLPFREKVTGSNNENTADTQPVFINLQEELSDASEEMADLVSALGRFSKNIKKVEDANNDLVIAILEDQAEEKINLLIKEVPNFRSSKQLIEYARSLFPDDCDLMMALRELLLSKKLTELQKKKVQEAISDLEKSIDNNMVRSCTNMGHIARRYATREGATPLTAKELRNTYLRFISSQLPATLIYHDWIDLYGCENRKRILAFTMSSLVADIKANEPGINIREFGDLSTNLSSARALNTLDEQLIENFMALPFLSNLQNKNTAVNEEHIIKLYMSGLIDFNDFKKTFESFTKDFMSTLLVRHKATAMQCIRNVYNLTPDSLYSNESLQQYLVDYVSSLMTLLTDKERHTGVWNEYYK